VTYIDDVAAEIRRRLDPELLPEGDADELFRMYAVLALAKGEAVQPEDVHDAWSAWMAARDPGHSSLRPFDELDDETRAADAPFVEAIRAVARAPG
jgi:hypothetical protein